MIYSYRWLIACLCAMACAASLGLALRIIPSIHRSPFDLASVSELDPSDPKYKEVMCGPVSLSVALGRIGVYRSPMDLASMCQVTALGVTLADLESVAGNTRLVDARARRISWDDLSRLDGVAVLFVRGGHFVAVDPREPPAGAAEPASVRVYEPERPAQWWTRERLEGVWAGEALVITRQAGSHDEPQDGARIDWASCFIDHGVLRGTKVVRYQFSFQNTGGGELVIGEIQKGCGCIEHTLSKNRLAPGESGVIDVTVDVDRVGGYFQQYIAVNTNDLATPKSVLRMAGGVPRARVVSSDMIRLEDLPQGGQVSHQFYVVDPGFSGAKIREVSFVPSGDSTLNAHLVCSISHDLIGDDVKRTPAGFHAKPSDHVVRLAFEANPTCPPGLFQGLVHLVLDADGDATAHDVIIQGMVVKDAHPVPRVGLVTLDPSGAGSAAIELRSHSKKDVQVVRTWTDSPATLRVERDNQQRSESNRFIIRVQGFQLGMGATPVQRAVSFELADGSVLSVPVSVYMPPR